MNDGQLIDFAPTTYMLCAIYEFIRETELEN